MSCHLNKCAFIANPKVIKSALNFSVDNEADPYSAEAWDNAWDDDAASKDANNQKYDDMTWLQECCLSLSPAMDILAIAHDEHAVFLSSKWDVNEESDVKLKFVSSFVGKLMVEKDEKITSVLCLPLASQKRSQQGGPDWTCIIVGFSSGFVRMYTENAEVLLSQLLHEEPVCHLKCKTYLNQHFPNSADQPEELVIVYSTVVVTIDGFGLFQTLRACRNQLARVSAGKQEATQPPPLSYKKFGLFKFADCEAAGTVTGTTFDHLVTESVRKGFYGSVKANVPSSSLLVTAGVNPYVGFYHATEAASQLLLTDVVHAVASKLFSFITHRNAGGLIGGLMGRNDTSSTKDKPKIEPATNLPVRFGIYDKRRQGATIVISPNKAFAAVSDVFGRVVLFDIAKGVAVRMWKGYRDAQCGWVEVEDNMKQKEPSAFKTTRKKRAFFLVIYAPRRGILEVWCAQQGPRVAAFNVGKSGRLLSPGYTMVCANFSAISLSAQHLSSCYFLDTDGFISKVTVPFHLTLSERNSKHIRDLHLLKELRLLLKSPSKNKAIDMVKILRDMRTSNIRLQALDSLFSSRHSSVDLVDLVVTSLLSHLEKNEPSESDYKTKLLKQSCVRALQLIKLYTVMNEINSKADVAGKEVADIDIQMYATTLCISETEVGRIMSYVTLHQTIVPLVKKQVRFLDDSATDLTFPDFMSFFNITDSPLQKSGDKVLTKNLVIDLKPNLSEKQMECLGGFLYHTSVYSGGCHSSLQKALKESEVLPEKLLHVLLFHWVANCEYCEDPQKWLNLQQVMKHISSLGDPKIVCTDSETISPWWNSVRVVLHQSTSNIPAYIAAIVSRSVSIILTALFRSEMRNSDDDKKLKEITVDEASESGESDWEAVSLDLEHWNLLMKQLEDVLLLSILLKSQPYGKVVVREVNISISSLLSGGQGTITDLIAVWAVCIGLKLELLSSFFSVDNEDDVSIPKKFVDDTKTDTQTLLVIKSIINDLRRKFPYSLNHDVLLANCSWEHLMQWNRNKDATEHLQQSLSCFRLIQGSLIKNGFATMMWKSCIVSKFEALSLLVEKVGKTPKERLCRKELEMNDNKLEDFIDYCCQLLNVILESGMAAEVEEVPKYQCEELWQDRDNQGPPPLILMALGQKASNEKSVYQHLTLATLLHLVISFQMKNSRPLSLFSSGIRKAFFRELHFNLKASPDNEDSTLRSARSQFLLRAASNIAQSITEVIPDVLESSTKPSSSSTENITLCGLEGQQSTSKYFNKVLDLGRDWDLNLDELRRHYVCEFYSGGHDLLAEQIMPAVTNKSFLASQLLLICGQRIQKFIFNAPDPSRNLAFVSPDLSTWLKTLEDNKLRCYNVPLQATLTLTNHMLVSLPEGGKEYELARSLSDTVSNLLLATKESS